MGPYQRVKGVFFFQRAPLAVLHFTDFCARPASLHDFQNTGFPGCYGTEFLERALFSNGSVCHSSHQWGAFVQRNVFKWLLNAAQSLHQDLMSSSPPGCCNRCTEASIEPFVTLDNLLPSRFIRTVTIQPSSCASLASADCFPARALAYVPTTHLLFHRQ